MTLRALVLLLLAGPVAAQTTVACNSGTLRPFDQAPINGSPIPIAPSGETIFEAEHFNCGGQNVAYHDNIAGNAGNAAFRTSEDIDIRTSTGSTSPVITNFEAGEWVTYTINVATAGTYDLSVRASNNMGTTVSQHFEVDGVNVGTVLVAATGAWDTFAWHTSAGVTLSAGQHVLKLYADQQYATVDQIRFTAVAPPAACNTGSLRPYDQAPVNGSPIPIPAAGATFEAEHFNCGGQNVAYHDNIAGNAGNAAFRTSEDIDIRTSTGSTSPVITNFETGEWVTYTINVATAGTYDLSVRASNNMGTTVSQHFELDGVNVGTVSIAATGAWDTFDWHTKTGVTLPAGQHVLKLYADQQYATIDQIRVVRAGGGGIACGAADLCVSFEANNTLFNTPLPDGYGPHITTTDLGSNLLWDVLNKANCSDPSIPACGDRMRLVSPGREGNTAIRIATLDLDNDVPAPPTVFERNQIQLRAVDTHAGEGVEQWWANSLMIPVDSQLGEVDGFGMSLFSFWSDVGINFVLGLNQRGDPANGIPLRTFLKAWNSGQNGMDSVNTQYTYVGANGQPDIGQCVVGETEFQKGAWYDFVHRIKWSSNGQGRHTIWAREAIPGQAPGPVKKVLDRGIGAPSFGNQNKPINTLYTGYNPLLKIGSYHDPVPNKSTSAIHDRLRRGASADAVRMSDFVVDENASTTNPDGTLAGCPTARPGP